MEPAVPGFNNRLSALRNSNRAPRLPALTEDATRRLNGAEARARYRLGNSLVAFFSKADSGVLKSSDHLDLLPRFERYAEDVFEARAKEYLPLVEDPKKYVKALTILIVEVEKAIGPNRLCRIEPREGNPKEIPFTFDQMRERAETEVREVPHFCEDTDEVEYETEPVDPWEEIDYSGIWEETLAQCWQLHKVRRNLPDDFEWRHLRALRDPFIWFGFRDEIRAHLRTKIPRWEAKAWRHHEATQARPRPGSSTKPTRHSRRGPKPKTEDHLKVAEVVRQYGDTWKDADTLEKICEALDAAEVPASKAWSRLKPLAHSWERAAGNYPDRVIKAIEYRLKEAEKASHPA